MEEISGTESHYINKLLDASCSGLTVHATATQPKDMKLFPGLPKSIVPVQLQLVNTSDAAIQLLAIWLEPQGSRIKPPALSASVDAEARTGAVIPLDLEFVAKAAHNSAREISLLRIKQFALFSFSAADPDLAAMILRMGLAQNEIISSKAGLTKVIFVPKSAFTAGSHRDQETTAGHVAFGNVVIQATRVTAAGAINSSSELSASAPGQDHSLWKLHDEVISLVVPLR